MPAYQSLVHETSTTTGTGDLTLASVTGWRTHNSAFGTGSGNTFRYVIRHTSASEWEEGIGYMSASTTLVRSVVLASSNSNAAVSFSSGTKEVNATASALAFGGMQATDKIGHALLSEVVTSGSQPTVTLVSITAAYRDLVLVVRGRGTASAVTANVLLEINADTGANYDWARNFWDDAFAGDETFGATKITLGWVTAATAQTSFASGCSAEILDYRGTTFYKNVLSRSSAKYSSSGTVNGVFAGWWRSTSAITSMIVSLSSGNFVDGSVVSLYGRY